jgi:hypothetical protein
MKKVNLGVCSSFLVGMALLFLSGYETKGSVAYGTINNFDTVNDTGVECHGFEIELEDIHSQDVTYTYNWNHYGTPRITEDNSNPMHPKVQIRYESGKTTNGTWAAYTAIPSGPIAPTDGHRFTDPSVNFGGEHFGAGYSAPATNITYHWLIDDGAGQLIRGLAVNVATPSFIYFPPNGGAVAQVQAVIRPPQIERRNEFGPASWVKEIRTTTHNNREIQLRNLVSDDPDDPNDKNWRNGEPDEVEVEWQLLQTDFRKADGGKNGELQGAPEDLNNGDEIITRRYEFYEYTGPLDPETGEALAETVAADNKHGVAEFADVVIVGDYVGSQMSAFDNELPLGLIEHLPDGEEGVAYPTRTIVIAATTFTVVTSGNLPAGIVFDDTKGTLSGTPSEGGIFTFEVKVTTTNNLEIQKKYILPVATAGEPLPPHSIVEITAEPVGAGSVVGGGFQTNDTICAVIANPSPGYGFVNWMEDGKVVSRSGVYTFTNIVNRTLVANFVPMPSISYLYSNQAGIELKWGTNVSAVFLQEATDLNSNWTDSTNAINVIGAENQVIISTSDGNRFFRLMKH